MYHNTYTVLLAT